MADRPAEEQTATEVEPPAPSFPGWVLWAAGLLAVLLVAFAVVLVLTGRSLRSYTNHGAGMLPTIHVGEQITVDMGDRTPREGDIVVFHPPQNGASGGPTCGASGVPPRPGTRMCALVGDAKSSQTYMKRVVGLPGDHLSLVGGQVMRNGQQRRAGFSCNSIAPYCSFPKPIVVPAGTYYVLGDNRSASDDSRFWGPVKRSWIVGILVHCSLLDSFCSRVH
jgi:signal peptidase I